MSSHKMVPLTKDEVSLLISLVEDHADVTSRATTASNNAQKLKAWRKITTKFNATITSGPRTLEQLRLKWENLKKAARKRCINRRMDIKNGSGPQDFYRPDAVLDRVASILRVSSEDFRILDREETNPDIKVTDTIIEDVNLAEIQTPIENCQSSTPDVCIGSAASGKVKRSITVEYINSKIARNLAMADYYNAKKQKLELEIEHFKNVTKKLSINDLKN